MTNVQSRFRNAHDLGEALKLLTAKIPSRMKNFRGKKKIWEDDVYENVKGHRIDQRRQSRSAKKVSLAPVKWVEGE